MDDLPRTPVALGAFAAATLALFALRDPIRSALWFFDGVDLIIHEAGHPVFGLFGWEFLQFAGGTLMQLIMPTAFVVHFLKENQPKSAYVCLAWVAHNFLWIGRYAADAQAQALPLVGGGEHDWAYMLGATGLIKHDAAVGAFFDLAGCALFAVAACALWSRFSSERAADQRPNL